jgi:exonuclease VII small subunit
MKNENIPADIKSKSLKEARDEINEILNKLEDKKVDLNSSIDDYQRLIQLNKYIDLLFKKKVKEISSSNKEIKKNDKE